MKKLRIEINDNRYQKDFEIKEDTDILLVIKKKTKTKVSFNVYNNITVRIKILSFCDSDSELFCEARMLGNNINYSLQSLALINNASRKSEISIIIPKGSISCTASEKEEAYLLTSNSKNNATVAVFSNEKDSTVNHSYSCNKISKQELLLLAARGIDAPQAQKLIIDTKIRSFIDF